MESTPAHLPACHDRRPNLALAFQELITAIVRLRFHRQSVSNVDQFRAETKEALLVAMQKGTDLGYASGGVNTAAYAVVAFLDESILNLRDPVFATWSGRPLQQELSQQHLAGEEFFECVQQLLSRRDSEEVSDILEVFQLCMLLGYHGRYGLSGMGELNAILRSTAEKIMRCRGARGGLSPHAALPLEAAKPKKGDKWLRRMVIAAGTIVGIAVGLLVLCRFVLVSKSVELQSLVGR